MYMKNNYASSWLFTKMILSMVYGTCIADCITFSETVWCWIYYGRGPT